MVRTDLTLALARNLPIHQLDVKNTFLHGTFKKTIWGLRIRIILLIYVISIKPCTTLNKHREHGFKDLHVTSSVWVLSIAASSSDFLNRIIAALSKEFLMTDMEPLHYFLGMVDYNPCKTPVDTNSKLGKEAGKPIVDPTLYRSLAGALQTSIPHLHSTRYLCCLFMHDPRERHFLALKCILGYIQGTSDLGLRLLKGSVSSLSTYFDADWADCPDPRRSTSGYCVFLGENLFTWFAKRESTVSHSSVVQWPIYLLDLKPADGTQFTNTRGHTMPSTGPPTWFSTNEQSMSNNVSFGQVRVLHVPSTLCQKGCLTLFSRNSKTVCAFANLPHQLRGDDTKYVYRIFLCLSVSLIILCNAYSIYTDYQYK
ncbi:hypothetical protein V2J09_005577 [Rumex salicifolius]